MNDMQLILTVDGGGSSSTATIYELSGFAVKETVVGPMSCKSSTSEIVSASLTELLAFMKDYIPQMKSCVLALSGLDSDKDIERMVELLGNVGFFAESPNVTKRSFATCVDTYWGFPVVLCSDALLPLFANYFNAGSVVIAGTGSIALNLSREGHITRYGGWGYQVSDEGSGTWVGVEFLRQSLAACDRSVSLIKRGEEAEHDDSVLIDIACGFIFDKEDPANKDDDVFQKAQALEGWSIRNNDPKAYASIAKDVIRCARLRCSEACEDIVEHATDKLAQLAALSFDGNSPFIVLSGGLFKNEEFAYVVKDKIFKLTDGKSTTIVNTKSPNLGGLEIVSYLDRM